MLAIATDKALENGGHILEPALCALLRVAALPYIDREDGEKMKKPPSDATPYVSKQVREAREQDLINTIASMTRITALEPYVVEFVWQKSITGGVGGAGLTDTTQLGESLVACLAGESRLQALRVLSQIVQDDAFARGFVVVGGVQALCLHGLVDTNDRFVDSDDFSTISLVFEILWKLITIGGKDDDDENNVAKILLRPEIFCKIVQVGP